MCGYVICKKTIYKTAAKKEKKKRIRKFHILPADTNTLLMRSPCVVIIKK